MASSVYLSIYWVVSSTTCDLFNFDVVTNPDPLVFIIGKNNLTAKYQYTHG